MGRQINFYMSLEDQIAMDELIRTKMPELFVIRHRMKERKIQLLESTLDETLGVKSMYLVLGTQIGHVVMREKNTLGWYFVDDLRSPIIEYSRSNLIQNDPRGKVLRGGRIYYQPSYFDGSGVLVGKNPDFLKAAQKLFGLFKRNLTLIKDRYFYFGEGALKLEKEGWILPLNN